MSEDIFSRIINGTANDDEKKEFYCMLDKDIRKHEAFCQLKNIYTLSSLNPSYYEHLAKESFTRFWEGRHPRKQRRILHLWIKYAAVFIIAVFAGYTLRYLFQNNNISQTFTRHTEFHSEKGSISSILLDDGSKIWLSSRTRILLDEDGKGEIIARLDGEAYFDMVPDPSRKFTVDCGNIKVKDIGTTFNIRAYSEEQKIYTLLIDGKIDLQDKAGKLVRSMKPNEYVQFDKLDKSLAISKKDPSYITAWKDGRFVFIDMSFSQICNELGNWYNVDFEIQNEELANTHYTSIIKRSITINNVLKLLTYLDNIQYTIIERKEGKDLIIIKK